MEVEAVLVIALLNSPMPEDARTVEDSAICHVEAVLRLGGSAISLSMTPRVYVLHRHAGTPLLEYPNWSKHSPPPCNANTDAEDHGDEILVLKFFTPEWDCASKTFPPLGDPSYHRPLSPGSGVSAFRIARAGKLGGEFFVRMPYAPGHGTVKNTGYLGLGLLYYALAFGFSSRLALVLGSGGGFLPALVSQAQRDRGGRKGGVAVVDANFQSKDLWMYHGSPQSWASGDSEMRGRFPEIELWENVSTVAARHVDNILQGRTLGYVHVDFTTTFEGLAAALADWLPLVPASAVVTIHDTNPGDVVAPMLTLLKHLGFKVLRLHGIESYRGLAIVRPGQRAGYQFVEHAARGQSWAEQVLSQLDRQFDGALAPCPTNAAATMPLTSVSVADLSGLQGSADLLVYSLAYARRPEAAGCEGSCDPVKKAMLHAAGVNATIFEGEFAYMHARDAGGVVFLHISTPGRGAMYEALTRWPLLPGAIVTQSCGGGESRSLDDECAKLAEEFASDTFEAVDLPCHGVVILRRDG